MPCLFCQREFNESEGRKRTREHIFAEWMAPYLRSPDEAAGTMIRWNTSFENRREDQTRYPGFPAQQAVQGVCAECNSGWLSRIQTAAKPSLLAALQSHQARSYGTGAQEAMNSWAYRAALMVGIKAGKARLPGSLLHDFYETRKPREKTRIWMVSTDHRKYTYIEHRLLAIRARPDDEPPPSPNGFATLICVGHVGFYVVSWDDAKPRGGISRLFEVFDQAVIPTFPIRKRIAWPPEIVLNHLGLDGLADVMGIWEKRPLRD